MSVPSRSNYAKVFDSWFLSHPQRVWSDSFSRRFPSSIENIYYCIHQLSLHYIWKLNIWIRVLESSCHFTNCSICMLGTTILLKRWCCQSLHSHVKSLLPLLFRTLITQQLFNWMTLNDLLRGLASALVGPWLVIFLLPENHNETWYGNLWIQLTKGPQTSTDTLNRLFCSSDPRRQMQSSQISLSSLNFMPKSSLNIFLASALSWIPRLS